MKTYNFSLKLTFSREIGRLSTGVLETFIHSAIRNEGKHIENGWKMKSETKQLLDVFYEPYNKQLADLLRSLHWNFTDMY